MKLFLTFLAIVVATYAAEDVIPDTSVDWSTVKHLMPTLPIPFNLQRTVFKERIVGGWETETNGVPYMAAIIATKATGNYLCGGSLISLYEVLTSAQCLDGASQVQVILGAHRLDIIETTQQRYYTTLLIIHEGWNPQLLINDIGVVRLRSPVELNDYVSVVAMPLFDDAVNSFVGETAVLSGWGTTSDDAVTPSEVLKKLYATVITNTVCLINFLGVIQSTHICTNGEGHIGACAGDAGGPLVLEDKQIGIISFVANLGCEVQWPTVYTRVTSFLDWIDAHSEAHIG